jgi:hypothetical protein
MKKFRTLTEPVEGLAGRELLLSLDPHSVPCFSSKFAISPAGPLLRRAGPAGKAYHAIRNKYMKLEQLFCFFDLARAVRSQKYMKQWRAIPEGRWTRYEEPDETKGRPPRVIEIANTTTRIGPDRTPVRTVVAREYHGRNKKECHHVLYTNVAREHAYSLVNEFRQRQRHEQAYRVGVHDLNLDALTHG